MILHADSNGVNSSRGVTLVVLAGMEVHAGWCGPCTAVEPTLKKLHWDLVEVRDTICAVRWVVLTQVLCQPLVHTVARLAPGSDVVHEALPGAELRGAVCGVQL